MIKNVIGESSSINKTSDNISGVTGKIRENVEKIGAPIKYISTRGSKVPYSFSDAIIVGQGPDKGLFLPIEIPQVSLEEIEKMKSKSYSDIAKVIFDKFKLGIDPNIVHKILESRYSKDNFNGFSEITPLVSLTNEKRISVLELGKGPTFAFKDMALQVFFELLSVALEITNKNNGTTHKMAIIGSTSGDTGKAAIEACSLVEYLYCYFLYPKGGVSFIQEKMMATQKGDNVGVMGIRGNFDDGQAMVKKILASKEFRTYMREKNNMLVTSANSINWGRIIPQIVYYFKAYSDLLKTGKIKSGEKINFVVPTGNFGDIFAGYYAKKMGLPIGKLVLASNENDVLDYFIKTGKYDIRDRELIKTSSPSMDIKISNNLERLLFMITDGDSEKVKTWMGQLENDKYFEVDKETLDKIQETFVSSSASKKQTIQSIKKTYEKNRYILDPHGAVGMKVARELENELEGQIIVLETAEPLKFPEPIYEAIIGGKIDDKNSFQLLKELKEYLGDMLFLPEKVMGLQEEKDIHTKVVDADSTSIEDGFKQFFEKRL